MQSALQYDFSGVLDRGSETHSSRDRERWKDDSRGDTISVATLVNLFKPTMRPRSAVRLFPIIALYLAVGQALAKDPFSTELKPDSPFQAHLHRDYFVRDGLPSNWINDVVQTHDGFVWIATDNGLVRYDGLRFNTIDRATTPQLPSDETRVLYESRDGSLWIGTTSGLARYRPGRPPRFEDVPEFHRMSVFAILEDSSGSLWVGTLNGTYICTRELKFEVVPDAPTNVRAICEDRNGTMWFGSNDGLFRRNSDAYERLVHEFLPESKSVSDPLNMSRVHVIRMDSKGTLWIGAKRALLHWKDGAFQREGRELGRQQVYDILETQDDCLYAAARFGLFRSHAGGLFEKVSANESVFCLTHDQGGRLWVGHGDNRGLHSYAPHPSEAIWNEATVYCVHQDQEGSLWIGSKLGLHHLHDGKVDHFGVVDGLPDAIVQTISPGAEDTLWIGTARGTAKWSARTGLLEAGPADLSNMNISAALEDSAGNLWVSIPTAGGFVLKRDELIELSTLNAGRIHWFWEDPLGDIWLGHETGLFRHHEGQFRQVSDPALEQLNGPRFLCHHVAGDGTLWMGTSNGIARYRAGRLDAFPPECGLRADNIERLAADNAGNLWFGGRDGLFHASIKEFDAFTSGDLSRIASFRVEGFERFPPIPAFSQGCVVEDQTVWVVGERGLSRLSVGAAQIPAGAPDIYIEHVVVDGVETPFEQGFECLAGSRRLMLKFVVGAVQFPQQVYVRYRIDGYDNHWLEAGRDRVAHYTDLRPGVYTFRVAARQGNEAWVEAEPVRFVVRPRWWETRLFQFASLIGFLGLVALGVQLRTKSVRNANEVLRREIRDRVRAESEARQRQEELARVSRAASMGELTASIAHEVKQPLFAIVSNAQTARCLLDADPPDIVEVREALSDIASDGGRASQIIDHVRSLLRKAAPPASQLDLNRVAQNAIQFCQAELRGRGLVVDARLAPHLPQVNGNAIELEQVILNFLINGAQAMSSQTDRGSRLILRTTCLDDVVELSLEDRGIGTTEKNLDRLFEPFYTTKPDGTGMGLAVNRTIVHSHGGRIWATRNADCGMTFHFSLPVCRSNAT